MSEESKIKDLIVFGLILVGIVTLMFMVGYPTIGDILLVPCWLALVFGVGTFASTQR